MIEPPKCNIAPDQNVLEIFREIQGFDCGYGGPYLPLSLANLLQEAAAIQAELLGFGAHDMGNNNLTWMLSRMDIRIERMPKQGETVRVHTWPAGFDKLFALRDFQVFDDTTEKPIISACYAYLVIDLNARRPVRPNNTINADLIPPRARAIADYSFKIEPYPADATSILRFRQTAMPRHIDHNGHVNNAHLVAWLCDAVSAERRASGELRHLRVEFLKEVTPGLTVDVRHRIATGSAPIADEMRYSEILAGNDLYARAVSAWQ